MEYMNSDVQIKQENAAAGSKMWVWLSAWPKTFEKTKEKVFGYVFQYTNLWNKNDEYFV